MQVVVLPLPVVVLPDDVAIEIFSDFAIGLTGNEDAETLLKMRMAKEISRPLYLSEIKRRGTISEATDIEEEEQRLEEEGPPLAFMSMEDNDPEPPDDDDDTDPDGSTGGSGSNQRREEPEAVGATSGVRDRGQGRGRNNRGRGRGRTR